MARRAGLSSIGARGAGDMYQVAAGPAGSSCATSMVRPGAAGWRAAQPASSSDSVAVRREAVGALYLCLFSPLFLPLAADGDLRPSRRTAVAAFGSFEGMPLSASALAAALAATAPLGAGGGGTLPFSSAKTTCPKRLRAWKSPT